MSDLTPLRLPATVEPVRVAVRRLRWLRRALADQLAAITAETGVAYRVDDRRLAAAFVSWLRRVEAQNPHDPGPAPRLLHLRRRADARGADPEHAGRPPVRCPRRRTRALPEYFWPEGFACTVFCVNVLEAVLSQEFDATIDVRVRPSRTSAAGGRSGRTPRRTPRRVYRLLRRLPRTGDPTGRCLEGLP